MHYHSPQHREPRLRRAARSPLGEIQLPSSTTLPDPTAPLPGASTPVAQAQQLDRMQAELKAVQQQALATQQSLKKLQARETVDPYTAIVAELPGLNGVNTVMLGMGAALALGALLIWWTMWRRPRARFQEAPETVMPAPVSVRTGTTAATPLVATPADNAPEWAPSTAASEFSSQGFGSSSSFAWQDPNMGFDPEAAANEVMRVRKSLADKREARAHFLEREDGEGYYASADPDIGLDLDLNLDEAHLPNAHAWLDKAFDSPATQPVGVAVQVQTVAQPEVELDLDLDPWRQPGEALPGAAAASDAIHFSLALEDYGVTPDDAPPPDAQPRYEPSMNQAPTADLETDMEQPTVDLLAPSSAEHPLEDALDLALGLELDAVAEQGPTKHAPGTKNYDFAVTMALAQESAALELWAEARDLASEVLESDDPALMSEALSLLERLNQQELEAPPDTNWNSMR